MKLFVRTALPGLFLTLPVAVAAQTDCRPEFVQTAQTVVVQNIDIGRNDFALENFQVRIRNGSGQNGPCSATLRVARATTSTSPNTLQLSLQARGQELQILPRETAPGSLSSDLLLSQVPASSNGFSLPFQLGIPSDWGVMAGTQTEDLLILLIDDSGQIIDTLPLTIRVTVLPSVEVRVVGATSDTAVARIDLGELEPNQTNFSDRFGLRVWSTSAYTVRFRSENGGKLVQSKNRGRIAYDLLLDQRPVNLEGGIALQLPRGTDALGDIYPLLLQVTPFQARAGTYFDRVEVTVTTN